MSNHRTAYGIFQGVPGTVVCFDIGGVLVRINHTWNEAALSAGVKTKLETDTRLNDSPHLIEYQAGQIDVDSYGEGLGQWLGTPKEEALLVHSRILVSDYPGALELVAELKSNGIWTCCFSNTNDLHWIVLTDPQHFPAVASLDQKIASHELRAAKPDVAAYKQVEEMLPLRSERIVFFDDTLENIYGAAEAGWEAFRLDPAGDTIAEARSILTKMELI